jgi:hypothetical protein
MVCGRRRVRLGELAHVLTLSGPWAVLVAGVVAVAAGCGREAMNGSHASSATRSARVPSHIATWAYDDSASPRRCNGGYGASRALVRRWLSYAETNCGPHAMKAVRDCHARRTSYCTVIQYFDAGKVWRANPIRKAPAHEHWWLHKPGYTDRSHRLREYRPASGTAYWLNQSVKDARDWIHHYITFHYNAWGGLLMDDTGACTQTQFYGSGDRSSQEIRTNSGVLREHRELTRALTHRNGTPFMQVDNGIQPNPYLCTALPLLDRRSGVVGLVSEGNPWDGGFSAYYSDLLDDVAAVDATRHDFIVLLSYAPGGSDQARLVQEATVMLGYERGHVVDWADLEQDNLHLAVWPEEGIYPTRPVQSMAAPRGAGCFRGKGRLCSTGGHKDLKVASGSNTADPAAGVYRREFGECYDRRVPFGPCAAIVNDTSKSVVVKSSWLTQSFGHEITLRGGDVQSGGRIDLSGATFTPGKTVIPADDAILLSR